MAIERQNGDIIQFTKNKDYIMVDCNLGSGSFGKTVLLKDPYIDELFVAKKYEPEFENDKEPFFKNFLDEIKILYKLNHRNIVRIYNYYAYEKAFTGYILMEYIDGKNLYDFIQNVPYENTTLDNVFLQLIDAFCYIENHNIIHRDIRERNILVDKTGTVKVIDFGIGKIFKSPDSNTDSLVYDINRQASDTLPEEYDRGVYTSLTDMFYLAEMLHRLIAKNEMLDERDFSYHHILNKMMEKNPQNRYENFASIREAIVKHDFVQMNISDEDKRIYQQFTNLTLRALDAYLGEPIFNIDITKFIERLEKTLKKNLFEDTIQNTPDIIKSLVNCGFRYNPSVTIPTDITRKFLDWFRASTVQSQELILGNFIAKLSNVKIDNPDEYPF